MSGAKTDAQGMTRTAFAARIGISRQRVAQLVKDGMPSLPNGRIDPEPAEAWYRRTADPRRRAAFRADPPAGARAELDALKVERERLALEKDRGALIERDGVRRFLEGRARGERDAWLGWAVRTAPLLAGELGVDPGPLFAALDREVRAQLVELAERPVGEMPRG